MTTPSLPRSPYDCIHGLVYFGRMLDKIRLHAAGKLPADYISNLGQKFDGSCLLFLGVEYALLVALVTSGATDEAAWKWCLQNGKTHTDEEIVIWNTFMRKYGWRDDGSRMLQRRLKEGGYEHRTDIQTFFDFLDLDEGREKKREEFFKTL